MLKAGPAQKVTIVVGEASRHGHEAVYVAVLNYLFYHDVADAFVTKAEAGFGGDHQMQSARFLETSLNVPIKIEFVEESAKVPALMPKLLELVADGFVSVQDITIVKGLEAGAPLPVRSAVLSGTAKLVRIFVGERSSKACAPTTWLGRRYTAASPATAPTGGSTRSRA